MCGVCWTFGIAMTIDDVYKLFGEASHWANIPEEQLGSICMLNERVINQDKRKTENATAIVEMFEKKTIGQLIGILKKVLGKELESEVDTIFKPALESRNRLIHGFFIDHHDILKDQEMISGAIAELNEIKNSIFLAADIAAKICTALTAQYQAALGSAAQPINSTGPCAIKPRNAGEFKR